MTKNGLKNLANFHMLKNSAFILESNMAEIDQNKNPKQPDEPDMILEINEQHN